MTEKSSKPEGAKPATPSRAEQSRRGVVQSIIAFKEAGILVIFFLLCIALSISSPYFLTLSNLTNVVRQFSMIAIISVGMTMVIITGGIDLSVGSIVGLAGCVAGWMLVDGYTIWFSIFVGLLVGILVGFVNGSLVVWVGLPQFIATLGTMGIARGLALVITRGYPLQPFPDEFLWIAQGFIGPIPVPVVIMIVVLVAGHIFLSKTTSGRYMYCIGSNSVAARLSGINVNKTLLMAYTITGFVSAISAIILISRLSSAQADNGTGWELDVIAATVIGGTSLAGGVGSVFGTLIGAAMMGVIRNALILLRVSVYWQTVVIGLVILVAVSLDVLRQRSRAI
ncbi:MAG: ABC transporter permease, partial [Anaerolineales bacterium]|nr:ABC transporter permease [Anaerolineales bacterium]